MDLVKHFTDMWKPKEKDPSLVSKIKKVGKPTENLKDQIAMVTQRLDIQTKSLDNAVLRFQNRDAEIFNRIVKAMAQREEARANILATELSEIRKVEKMLSNASLALQSVSMRLNTVSEMGDLVAILNPAKSLLGNIRSEMCSILPEASQELGNIGNLLSDICTPNLQDIEMHTNTTSTNSEAMQILQEAETAAEKKLFEQLPEVTSEKHIQKRTGIEV
jgi:division protein CdvB (Snf7/Vps24/ESCRT-III family)